MSIPIFLINFWSSYEYPIHNLIEDFLFLISAHIGPHNYVYYVVYLLTKFEHIIQPILHECFFDVCS